MRSKNKQVDAYISASEKFAQPVLKLLRSLVHKACPEVEESIKWGFPHFGYKGMLCFMAAFKAHCTFGFWKGSLLRDEHQVMVERGQSAMGHFGKITSISDLPADKIMLELLKEAVRLNEENIKVPAKAAKKLIAVRVPSDLKKALAGNTPAAEVFDGFSNSNKKEYIEWIEEAKTEVTRKRRLDQAIVWMAEGKVRNWKYIRK